MLELSRHRVLVSHHYVLDCLLSNDQGFPLWLSWWPVGANDAHFPLTSDLVVLAFSTTKSFHTFITNNNKYLLPIQLTINKWTIIIKGEFSVIICSLLYNVRCILQSVVFDITVVHVFCDKLTNQISRVLFWCQ